MFRRDASPLRGLYGANPHVIVCFNNQEAGVAILESMLHSRGRTNMFAVFKLQVCKEASQHVGSSEDVVFVPPSFQCGKKDIRCVGVEMWDHQKNKMVTKDKLTKQEVQSLAVLDAKPSLMAAAARLTSYIIQRLEKSTVHCDPCERTFRMSVDIDGAYAKANKIITWSAEERRQFIDTQRELGICTFSAWEAENYTNKCRSWFADYVAWAKQCPVCNRNTVHHKCMNCRRKMSECLAQPCEWQRTKRAFWTKK